LAGADPDHRGPPPRVAPPPGGAKVPCFFPLRPRKHTNKKTKLPPQGCWGVRGIGRKQKNPPFSQQTKQKTGDRGKERKKRGKRIRPPPDKYVQHNPPGEKGFPPLFAGEKTWDKKPASGPPGPPPLKTIGFFFPPGGGGPGGNPGRKSNLGSPPLRVGGPFGGGRDTPPPPPPPPPTFGSFCTKTFPPTPPPQFCPRGAFFFFFVFPPAPNPRPPPLLVGVGARPTTMVLKKNGFFLVWDILGPPPPPRGENLGPPLSPSETIFLGPPLGAHPPLWVSRPEGPPPG